MIRLVDPSRIDPDESDAFGVGVRDGAADGAPSMVAARTVKASMNCGRRTVEFSSSAAAIRFSERRRCWSAAYWFCVASSYYPKSS